MTNYGDKEAVKIYLRGIEDIIKDNKDKIERFEFIKMNSLRSAPFEVGYLYFAIQEEYRRMVDKYNITIYLNTRLYLMEMVLYLEEIEMGYWHIEHLCNMMHEIERKYKDRGSVHHVYINPDLTTQTRATTKKFSLDFLKAKKAKKSKKPKKKDVKNMEAFMYKLYTTRKRSTRWWWPHEYGWEIDYWW